ncbi:cyclic AMP-responsive element-binding protein 3-like protein 4 [Synchiropus splendidus]|uniref:cyclic AMP-responsive element-binding protein 3-like protein 4 n=1 Tax=Synchiropus splendidus TaxID=270530 RepID=UPI00237D9E22|nr:cyclic AMP-responsive element-binding protein 3-like protein 4 [Synchiropus splendidus]
MDAESCELFLGQEIGLGVTSSWQLEAPVASDNQIFHSSELPLQDWSGVPDCTLSDSESRDVLHGVDPNEVFPSGPLAEPSSESDSGLSEDQPVETTAATMVVSQPATATVYQLVYDISGLGSVKAGQQNMDVISIQLGEDEWNSQMLLTDSCVVNELALAPAARGGVSQSSEDPSSCDLTFSDLQLTEEEQKLLNQEGVSLPSNLPLTKAEERILKRVRRKIRNKQSAQDSRRRRKEYIDGLESRAAACSAQNKELQRTVETLEKHNMSLLSQLRQLQSLIKQTVSKGAQTSTCLLIILVSLGLIILPSFSPFKRDLTVDDDYRPTGVISRNILTEPAGPQSSTETTSDNVVVQSSSSPPVDPAQSDPPGGALVSEEPAEHPAVPAEAGSQPVNSSSADTEQAERLVVGLSTAVGSHDPAKPPHADEM